MARPLVRSKAGITELRPARNVRHLAERVIGDHDRNTLRLRLDPEDDRQASSRATVWIETAGSVRQRSQSNFANLILHAGAEILAPF